MIKALLHFALTGGQVVQLIMEYLPKGSLKDYLPKHKLSMPQCLMFAQQICEVSSVVCAHHVHFHWTAQYSWCCMQTVNISSDLCI